MIRYCRARGTLEMTAVVLHANHRMLALAKSLAFATKTSPEGVVSKPALVSAAIFMAQKA